LFDRVHLVAVSGEKFAACDCTLSLFSSAGDTV